MPVATLARCYFFKETMPACFRNYERTDNLSQDELLAREEDDNRRCLVWARNHLAVSLA
jgi:hypothetical protein